jgi:hypothetical protein
MKSISIIQETRPGMLAEITTLLEQVGIDLRSIDGSTADSLAVINLIGEPYQKCLEVLSRGGFKVFENEQILVRIKDHPGALAELSRDLANAQVDVRSINIVQRDGEECVVAMATENDFSARQVLAEFLV